MKYIICFFILVLSFPIRSTADDYNNKPIRVLVITGGHDYNTATFNAMLNSFGNEITYQVAEFPAAFDMFLPDNRDKYDVLVFYHMWQTITEEQKKTVTECISQGKPVVVLHHSICAFDDWPEYWRIVGGKYFHKPTVVDGKEYPACTYIHDLHFVVNVVDKSNPVTKGIRDFEVFDETYKGYWVEPGVTPILTTNDTTSNHVIGWTKTFGKARIVTLQSGHDSPTFQNQNFRQLVKQAIEWVYAGN